MRTLLFTGLGGAGTTTLAASAAVRAARAGRRTVLLSRQDVGSGLGRGPSAPRRRVDPAGCARAALGRRRRKPGPGAPAADPPAVELRRAAAGQRGTRPVRRALPARTPTSSCSTAARSRPRPRWSGCRPRLRWWLDHAPAGVRALGAVRTAASPPDAARRGPVDAALSARASARGAAGPRPARRPADGTAVCLVAPRPPAASRDCGRRRPRWPPDCASSAVLTRVRCRTGRGSGERRGRTSRTAALSRVRPRSRRCSRSPSWPPPRPTPTASGRPARGASTRR